MKKKARVIDAYSCGSYHEVVNQGYLMMISQLYGEVTYIAEKKSINNLKSLLDACCVDYSNVTFVEKTFRFPKFKRAGLNYLLKLIIVSFFNYYYYIKSSKDEDVFYNNNLFFALALISNLSFWKKNCVYVMCHNEMEMIDRKKRNTGVMKIWGYFLKRMFSNSVINKKIKLLLLSPKMVDYLKKFISTENFEQIDWVDHCYIRPQNRIVAGEKNHKTSLKIGVPGAITETRGLHQLKKILKIIDKSNVKLQATSFVAGIQDSVNFECLNKKGGLLPFPEYNAFIQQMDVLVLFYEVGSYKLTASGAILEAIWNLKPVFALKNDYFEYLFDRFGKIGRLFDCEDELADALMNLRRNELDDFRLALQHAKDSLHPNYVKLQLQNILRGN